MVRNILTYALKWVCSFLLSRGYSLFRKFGNFSQISIGPIKIKFTLKIPKGYVSYIIHIIIVWIFLVIWTSVNGYKKIILANHFNFSGFSSNPKSTRWHSRSNHYIARARRAIIFVASGVARAFPGERAAHLEDQNEEENEENLRKYEINYRNMGKDWGNGPILPTREWEAGYGPVCGSKNVNEIFLDINHTGSNFIYGSRGGQWRWL